MGVDARDIEVREAPVARRPQEERQLRAAEKDAIDVIVVTQTGADGEESITCCRRKPPGDEFIEVDPVDGLLFLRGRRDHADAARCQRGAEEVGPRREPGCEQPKPLEIGDRVGG